MDALRNKKTTFMGLSTLLAGICSFWVTKDLNSLATSVATGLGLLLAQDGGL